MKINWEQTSAHQATRLWLFLWYLIMHVDKDRQCAGKSAGSMRLSWFELLRQRHHLQIIFKPVVFFPENVSVAHHPCFPLFSSSQESCVSWSTTRSTSSRCPAPTHAPSSPCPGWSWGGKSPSAALRAATPPPSPFTPSLSMEGRYTGECYRAVLPSHTPLQFDSRRYGLDCLFLYFLYF